jgi:hypothetical protein
MKPLARRREAVGVTDGTDTDADIGQVFGTTWNTRCGGLARETEVGVLSKSATKGALVAQRWKP